MRVCTGTCITIAYDVILEIYDLQCDEPFSSVSLPSTSSWLSNAVLSFSATSFSDGCLLSVWRRFWNLAGWIVIWALTALSSLVFLCTPDSPTMLTSSTTVSDMTSSEYSSHASSSGSCIPLMRSAEHFRKASDAALRGAAPLFFGLELLGLGESRAGEDECGKPYSRGQLRLQWNSWQQSSNLH